MSDEKIIYESDPREQTDYKLLGIFNSLLIITLLLCDVFVFKIINIFGYSLALSGVLFPLTALIMICINEIYGHKQAAICLINLITAQVCFLTGLVLLPKIPAVGDYAENINQAYNIVFHDTWRVFLSSPVGIAVTLYLSSIINSKLKTKYWGDFLIVRVITNSAITTLILVSIIYPINFYHILSAWQIIKICIHTYFYKVIMSIIALFISFPIIRIAKGIEKKYIFDINVSFNPFYIYSRKSSGINLYEEHI